MPDLHYEHPRLAALYDLACGWSKDRDFYLSLAQGGPKSILDLGCGTGLICDAYAAGGHDVTGADPSARMLDIAGRKPNGGSIEWVECCSQDFRSEKRFDLIIMTGHAFQVLLDEDAILATFAVMREHLAHGGRIVFESRNPKIDWKARWDGGVFELIHDGLVVRKTRDVVSYEEGRAHFETRYHFPEETLVSESELLFLSRNDIERHLEAAGLRADAVYGDWDRQPFDERKSEEMIFVVRRAVTQEARPAVKRPRAARR
ncbi:methyltransferase domain-containing protein [Rhizobium sp. LjRoot258]|uniref:class I SAM-dependent DNA methyltransferase n=1 Tax=Rhizobium sp. LjRoot258 TaxID=3342299 RepID=UPI003ECF269B